MKGPSEPSASKRKPCACASFMHNGRGECYLAASDGSLSSLSSLSNKTDTAVHQTVVCAKLGAKAAEWRARTWPFSGYYRLGDMFWCGYLSNPQLDGPEFFCGGLDAVNIGRLWPGSLAHEYAWHASMRKTSERDQRLLAPRTALLTRIIEKRRRAGNACREPPPNDSSCVFHIRMGDIFQNCGRHSADCTDRSAAELWRGDAQRKARGTGETRIRPRAHFERALDHLPKGKDTIVISGAPHIRGPGKEKDYVELLSAFLESRGLRVRRRMHAATLDGFNSTRTDCDVMYMSAASCYLPSAGGFSNLIASVVRRRGGLVLTSPKADRLFCGLRQEQC